MFVEMARTHIYIIVRLRDRSSTFSQSDSFLLILLISHESISSLTKINMSFAVNKGYSICREFRDFRHMLSLYFTFYRPLA